MSLRNMSAHVILTILVTPQRSADPGKGIVVEPQTIAPAVVPLNGTLPVSLLLQILPGEARIQLRKIRFGQLLFQVLKGEKERGTVSFSRNRGHRRQHDGESKRREERFPYALLQYFAKRSHCSSPFGQRYCLD